VMGVKCEWYGECIFTVYNVPMMVVGMLPHQTFIVSVCCEDVKSSLCTIWAMH
jgi:hypothetical protein